jgi:hypothetical protein
MHPNSAYSLIPIAVGTNYTPVEQFITYQNPNGQPVVSPCVEPQVSNGLTPPVFALFCTATNTGTTQVQLLGDSAPTSFPAGSFKQGVVYYMYLAILVADGGGSFIGYKYAQYPFIF